MRAQHGEILNLQRATAVLHEIVDLAIIIEQIRALLRNLLAREIMCFELDVARKADGGGFVNLGGGIGAPEGVREGEVG